MGTGQLHLYNVLRAYSNFDLEVGYCQGIFSIRTAVLCPELRCRYNAIQYSVQYSICLRGAGLSFVAGVLLLHLEEVEAFGMLVYLMFGLGTSPLNLN